jgi:hypothetical protein
VPRRRPKRIRSHTEPALTCSPAPVICPRNLYNALMVWTMSLRIFATLLQVLDMPTSCVLNPGLNTADSHLELNAVCSSTCNVFSGNEAVRLWSGTRCNYNRRCPLGSDSAVGVGNCRIEIDGISFA